MQLRHKNGSVEIGKFLKTLGDTVGKNGDKGSWTRVLYRLESGRVAEAFVPASGRPVSEADVHCVRDASRSESEMQAF